MNLVPRLMIFIVVIIFSATLSTIAVNAFESEEEALKVLLDGKGFSGKGVKIGVIDMGFTGYRDNDNITNRYYVKSFYPDGNMDMYPHGNAVAEVISSLAPNATLYLVNRDPDISLEMCVDYLLSMDVDIITESVAWINYGWIDGTGPVDEAAKKAVDGGVLFINSAGNYATTHWSGIFNDTDGDGFTEFENGKEYIEIESPYPYDMILLLTWDDWPLADQDYDMYLYRGNVLEASSTIRQTGSQAPDETLIFDARQGTYRLYIKRHNGSMNNTLEVLSAYHDLEPHVEEGSVTQPGDSPDVLTVGATYWLDDTIEWYSSRGPTRDGRLKPDIVAPDGMPNSVYGNFYGTSASTPYTAAVAALLLEADPTLTNHELKDLIIQGAKKDLGEEPLPNNTYGYGRVDLNRSLNLLLEETPPEIWDMNVDGAGTVVAVVSEESIRSVYTYVYDGGAGIVLTRTLSEYEEVDGRVFRIDGGWSGQVFRVTDGKGNVVADPVTVAGTESGYYIDGTYGNTAARLVFDGDGMFLSVIDESTWKEVRERDAFTVLNIAGYDGSPVYEKGASFHLALITPQLVPYYARPGMYEVGLEVTDFGGNTAASGVGVRLKSGQKLETITFMDAFVGDKDGDGLVSTGELTDLLGWIDLTSPVEVSWFFNALEMWDPSIIKVDVM